MPNASSPARTVSRALGALLALCLGMSTAFGADVQFNFSPRATWVGSPTVLTITVSDGDDISDPVFPSVEGLAFELQPGRQTMSSMQFINGKVSQQNTSTLTCFITPTKAGTFTIPPISPVVDGTTHASKPTGISSIVSSTGDLLKVEVVSEPSAVWVGQSMRVILRIEVKPFRSEAHRKVLDEADMWRFMDPRRCEFGVFKGSMAELEQRGQRPMGHEDLVGGTSCLVYEVAADYTPTAPGTPNFSDIRIAWNYPTRLTENRGFFGRPELTVSGSKPISAVAQATGIEVKPLPEAGRPDSFRGAIGDFSVSASAKPDRVGVGDPITLTLVMTDRGGGGALAQLQPPPLDSPELERDFRMPTAPLAGTIAGATKTFTQTLRPVRAGIDSIGPIAFSWFDPMDGRYKTASTRPIDIVVVPSERLTTQSVLGTAGAAPREADAVVAASGGVVANMVVTESMLEEASWWKGSLGIAALLAVPPMACAALLLTKRRRDRLQGDIAYARAHGARAAARGRMKAGDSITALLGFIADHANRPSGTLTRRDTRVILERVGASPELIAHIDSVLSTAERSTFSASASDGTTRTDPQSVAQAIESLGQLDWSRVRGEEER